MKDKVKYEKPKLYFCDPAKHPQCKKTFCYLHRGCCELTQYAEYAKTDANGKPIEWKEDE